MKIVFICSPYRGDIKTNVKNAKKYCRLAIKNRLMPIAPHLYFTRFLKDSKNSERNIGIKCGIRLLKICDEVWVFGDIVTKGMEQELKKAISLNKPIVYKGVV